MESVVHQMRKLQGTQDYQSWAYAAEGVLRGMGLWGVIQKNRPTEEGQSQTKWDAEDSRALGILITLIDPSLYVHTRGKETAKQVWESLKMALSEQSGCVKMQLMREFMTIKLKEGGDVQKHLDLMLEIYRQLKELQVTIGDTVFVSCVLASLPASYEMLTTSLQLQKEVDKASVLRSIKTFAASNGQSGKNGGNGQSDKSGVDAAEKVLLTSKQGNKHKRRACFECGGSDHIRADCVKYAEKLASQGKQDTHTRTRMALLVKNQRANPGPTIILDSGASTHVIKDRGLFVSLDEGCQEDIKNADGQVMTSRGLGNISFTCQLNGGVRQEILLTNCHYVPGALVNLVSIGLLLRKGCKVAFEKNYGLVFKGNQLLMKSFLNQDSLYEVVTIRRQVRERALLAKVKTSSAPGKKSEKELSNQRSGEVGAKPEPKIQDVPLSPNVMRKNVCKENDSKRLNLSTENNAMNVCKVNKIAGTMMGGTI